MPIHFTLILAFFLLIIMQTGRMVITLYALNLGAQPFTVGVLASVLAMLPALFSWNVGRFSDRFGSRWPLLLCSVAGVLGMMAPYAIPGLLSLFVASVMYGSMSALAASPLQNLVGLLSGPEDSAKNFSNLSLMVSFAGFAGPLMAGFSLDHAGPDIACLILVLLSLVPATMLVVWGRIFIHLPLHPPWQSSNISHIQHDTFHIHCPKIKVDSTNYL